MLVREQISHFGANAGKIWGVLRHQGPQSKEKLIELTHLTEHEFYPSIGWLARENKIWLDENKRYYLK